MNEYKIIYKCANGFEGEEIVMAVNRMMAFEVFEELGIEDVVDADCFRVMEDNFDMKTTEERVSIMIELENLVDEWQNYIESFGNECAHTDSIIEQIKKLAEEL